MFAEKRKKDEQSNNSVFDVYFNNNFTAAAAPDVVKLGPTPFNSNMGQAAAAVALANSGECSMFGSVTYNYYHSQASYRVWLSSNRPCSQALGPLV